MLHALLRYLRSHLDPLGNLRVKYGQYLIIAWIITESFYRHNKLSATHDEVDESHGKWRIIVVQSKCKTELTYHVVVCIFSTRRRDSQPRMSPNSQLKYNVYLLERL